MKILFASRSDCLSAPGGDTVQMLKTIEYLKTNHNIDSQICLKPEEIINDKDSNIVHIFNLQTIDETLQIIKACKTSKKKIILSTVYWDLSHHVFMHKLFQISKKGFKSEFNKKLKRSFIKLASLRDFLPIHNECDSYATTNYIEKRRQALLEADILIPNSDEELNVLSKEFKIERNILLQKSFIIPNAVDIKHKKINIMNDSVENPNLNNLTDYVLEVGRIEVNKNQYNVVKALYNHPEIPIVFIGRVNNNKVDFEYFNELKELSSRRGNVYFVNQIDQKEVFEYFKKARVHVLPSYRESPGLSSLEALYFGCEIVTSSEEFCPIDYYKFNDKAHICDPYSYKSIRDSILEAYNNPKNSVFDEEYFKIYSYDNVSNLMKDIYTNLS